MARIFISYNHNDAALASGLADALRHRGHQIRIDTALLTPGVDWRTTLDEGLQNSEVLVAVLTRNTATSGFVAGEIGAARAKAKESGEMLIIPVIADSIAVPSHVSDLFAVIEPGGNIPTIAEAIDMAITSSIISRKSRKMKNHSLDDSARDRTLGLVLSAVVVVAFIAFIFVPPERLNPATLPVVRFLAALAAALAAYLFIGRMSVSGQLPFLKRLGVKAAGSFAAFLIVLLLFYRGIPTDRVEPSVVQGAPTLSSQNSGNSLQDAKDAVTNAQDVLASVEAEMEALAFNGDTGAKMNEAKVRRAIAATDLKSKIRKLDALTGVRPQAPERLSLGLNSVGHLPADGHRPSIKQTSPIVEDQRPIRVDGVPSSTAQSTWRVHLQIPTAMSAAEIRLDGEPALIARRVATIVTIEIPAGPRSHEFRVESAGRQPCVLTQSISESNTTLTPCQP